MRYVWLSVVELSAGGSVRIRWRFLFELTGGVRLLALHHRRSEAPSGAQGSNTRSRPPPDSANRTRQIIRTVTHLLINGTTSESETARAARLLGFNVGASVRVIAVESTGPVDTALPKLRNTIVATTSGRVVAAAMSSTLAVVLATTTEAPPGSRPRTPPSV